jgi:hypothetical protein
MFSKMSFQEAIEYVERALSKVYIISQLQERQIHDLPSIFYLWVYLNLSFW